MGNLEKYGVLALIFVIVLILTVAIWNGPVTDPHGGPKPSSDVAAAPHVAPDLPPGAEQRPAVQEMIRKQREEQERAAAAAAPSGGLEPSPAMKTYVVSSGDTLASIAKKELGASSKWNEIVKANEGLDPKRLKIGQKLQIPAASASSVATEKADRPEKSEKTERPRVGKRDAGRLAKSDN